MVIGIWALGLAALGWLAWQYRREILAYLGGMDPLRILPAFGWYLGSLAAIVIGWVALMRHFAPGLPGWTHIWIYCTTLVSRRLPGTLWYVGGRLVLYRREGISGGLISLASGVEFAAILVSGALVGFVMLPLAVDSPAALVATLVLTGLFVAFSPRWMAWIAARFNRPFPVPVRRVDVLVWLAALSLMWLAGGMMLVAIIRAFQPLPPEQVPFILSAWALAGAMGSLTFFLPSSFGVNEISLAFFLSSIMPAPQAGTVAVVARILSILFEVLVAVIFLPWVSRQKKQGEGQ